MARTLKPGLSNAAKRGRSTPSYLRADHSKGEDHLSGHTPYEFVCQAWTKELKRFRLDPSARGHQTLDSLHLLVLIELAVTVVVALTRG